MEYFIDALDVMEYKPIIPTQATLELIRVYHQDAPVEGIFILSIKKGYILKKEAVPERNGFLFIFEEENQNAK